jgi:transposase
MSKSGNRHVRWMTTELAWSWRRYQPERALRVWCRERFGSGGKRLRRIGMVAVARKLLMALWRFLETGVFPEGAVRKEGEALCRCRLPLRPWCWWRRPEALPGLPRTPS